jgi:SAM-dependent MidA family methyltransferase
MTESKPLSPAFSSAFLAKAEGTGVMRFDAFMALALYHPKLGYYRRDKTRVGYGAGTDFYTASTSGAIFGELVAASCTHLLGDRLPTDFTFVEIGAESAAGVMTGVSHPFAAVRTCRVGEPIELSGRCVVFSNELFDAQPFRRFVFRGQAWRELGVALRDGALMEVEIPTTVPSELPSTAPDGYVIDAPLAARSLATTIAGQPWTGLFLAFDYGKSWRELIEATPIGTARAYSDHRQSNDLLSRPGEQDLTCHICWDWMADAVVAQGFANPAVESQEAFFVHHAAEFIARATTADAARFSQRKLSLLQLLHPSHLGQKFQVLHARRD